MLSASVAYLLQGGGMVEAWWRVIQLWAHVQSRDTEQEGSGGREGEIELVHLQLVPVDCGKDYTQRVRE